MPALNPCMCHVTAGQGKMHHMMPLTQAEEECSYALSHAHSSLTYSRTLLPSCAVNDDSGLRERNLAAAMKYSKRRSAYEGCRCWTTLAL